MWCPLSTTPLRPKTAENVRPNDMTIRKPAKPKPQKNGGKVDFVGYVPYSVNNQLKGLVKEELGKGLDLTELISSRVEAAITVTVKWDTKQDCYHVSWFDNNIHSENRGLILSARHTDMKTAFALLKVLDAVVFGGAWPLPVNQQSSFDW